MRLAPYSVSFSQDLQGLLWRLLIDGNSAWWREAAGSWGRLLSGAGKPSALQPHSQLWRRIITNTSTNLLQREEPLTFSLRAGWTHTRITPPALLYRLYINPKWPSYTNARLIVVRPQQVLVFWEGKYFFRHNSRINILFLPRWGLCCGNLFPSPLSAVNNKSHSIPWQLPCLGSKSLYVPIDMISTVNNRANNPILALNLQLNLIAWEAPKPTSYHILLYSSIFGIRRKYDE